jgi:alpha-1,3-glucosyltransferase
MRSIVCVFSAQLVNNDWVALHKSRGFESQEHKLFMRLSVILTMLLIYAPAILTVHQYWYCDRKKTKKPVITEIVIEINTINF